MVRNIWYCKGRRRREEAQKRWTRDETGGECVCVYRCRGMEVEGTDSIEVYWT
ncbi:uncharacterized protein G2W53_029689 [Senna tora]|uniref:Uncharacterized protein n=1 Tax=Senna tora TaxID=362788 RepID=A0A834W9V8_9FABA|nr:uncharacterized protein G2W53_029689 [Senna tora]